MFEEILAENYCVKIHRIYTRREKKVNFIFENFKNEINLKVGGIIL